MALMDVGDVVAMVAAVFDDPSQSDIDVDYVLPFINLRWSNIVTNMVMLGLQYAEDTAIFDVPANTFTLKLYMGSGQPLASLMQPKTIEWKPVGAPDTEYTAATLVDEVDDVDPGSQGILQYAWKGGSIRVTKSAIPVTLRVRYQAMSTQLVDPDSNMLRGIGDVLAYRVSEIIAIARGMTNLKVDMIRLGDSALDDFLAMSNMQSQAKLSNIPATHRRGSRSRFVARAT